MRLRFHPGTFDSGKTMTMQPGLFDTQPLLPGWKLWILKLLISSSGALRNQETRSDLVFKGLLGSPRLVSIVINNNYGEK
jgi:hypothetical protein